MMRIGSLCSGYGGLDMAVRAVLGGEIAWHAELDPDASKVLAHHQPNVPNLGDIKLADWATIAGVDALTAGYPCQPFSDAGLRLGVEDERHIWPYIADAIRVLRPRLVVLENVRGHLGRGFTTVLGDLADLGFDACWTVVRASDVGAPHQRERLFVAAQPADTDRPGLEGSRLQRSTAERHLTPPDPDREQPERWGGAGLLGGAAAAESHEGDQRQRAGHAAGDRGPAPADPQGNRWDEGWPEPAWELRRPHASVSSAPVAADTPSERHGHTGPAGVRGFPAATVAGDPASGIDWGTYEPTIRRWEHVTGRPAPRPTEPGRTGERLSPAFVEWMMGLPVGHVTDVPDISRNAQLRLLGNGVVWQQGAHALAHLLGQQEAVA